MCLLWWTFCDIPDHQSNLNQIYISAPATISSNLAEAKALFGVVTGKHVPGKGINHYGEYKALSSKHKTPSQIELTSSYVVELIKWFFRVYQFSTSYKRHILIKDLTYQIRKILWRMFSLCSRKASSMNTINVISILYRMHIKYLHFRRTWM